MHSFFLLTSQENKGVFFVRILKFLSTWRLFDFLHLHYVYIIYVCVEVQRGMSNGRLFFTVVSLAIPFTQVAKYYAIHVHILVQQIIILNAISMVDWNLFLYIVQCFRVVLVFFHSILKAPKL